MWTMRRCCLLVLAVWIGATAPCAAETLLSIDASAPAPAPVTGYLHTGARASPSGHVIDVNSRYLTLDGKPWLPVMGEFHFSRSPAQFWDEELAKMRAAGIDIVSTYIIWQHHEERDGQFDWSGDRDLRRFVELCAKHKLYVFLRPGPWVHAEVRFGGIPDWVVAAMPTRASDPTYLSYVGRFYERVGEQVKGLMWKDGGPVIGVQIENEYFRTGAGEGRGHVLDLKRLAVKAGFDVPLYTVTAWDNTIYPAQEVAPVFGSYPDAPWAISPSKSPPNEAYEFRFKSRVTGDISPRSLAATAAGDADHDAPNTPFLSAEYAAGLPSMYRRRTVVTPDDIASLLPIQIGSGVNLYGYYMFHGGRNPVGLPTREENTGIGGYNDLPALGYDFQAPLGEYGQMHRVLGKLRPVHLFLSTFGSELAPMVVRQPDRTPSAVDDFSTPRYSVRSFEDRGFLFVSNHVRLYPMARQQSVRFSVKLPSRTLVFPTTPIDIPTDSYFIWPINMKLDGATLTYGTAQPVTRVDSPEGAVFVFREVDGIPIELALDVASVSSVRVGAGASKRIERDGRIVISGIHAGTQAAATLRTRGGATIRILVLTQSQAEQLWAAPLRGQVRLILTDAQLIADDGAIELRSTGEKSQIRFGVFPSMPSAPEGHPAISRQGQDGVFDSYTVAVPVRQREVTVTRLRDAQPVPPIAIGGPAQSSLEPYPETFGRSAAWTIALPADVLADVSDAYLQIRYQGDVVRLFSGTDMIDDAYYNGLDWEIGLKRFASIVAKPLTLTILPLRQDAPIYLEPEFVPKRYPGGQVAELERVSLRLESRVRVH